MESADCANDYFAWEYLRTESKDWAASTSSVDFRWQTLCVAASWVLKFPETWGYCFQGSLAMSLVAFFCAERIHAKQLFFEIIVTKHRLNAWLGILTSNWYIFDILVRGSPRVAEEAQQILRTTEYIPRQCEGDFEGGRPVDAARRAIFDAAQTIVSGDADLYLETIWDTPEIAQACQQTNIVPDLAGATSCILRALIAPNREEAYAFAGIGEQAIIACAGVGSERMLPILLWTQWPLVSLLCLVHKKLLEHDLGNTMSGFNGSREMIGSWAGIVLWNDITYPWVRHLAATVPLHEIYQELTWPQNGPSFGEIVEDINQLLDKHSFTPTLGGAGYGLQWNSMCFICKDGTESLDTSEGTIYKKTPALYDAPSLSRFIDLFGETGRVRLSGVMPGGIIGWHPDNGVAESGRMILHIPLQTSTLALNRLGHALFHMQPGHIHWLDYSYPHTVYNGDSTMPRIHLVIDVKVPGNEAFATNFLRRLEPNTRERLIDTATQSNTVVSGRRLRTVISRGMSADMATSFCHYYQNDAEREAYERHTWEHVAYSVGAL